MNKICLAIIFILFVSCSNRKDAIESKFQESVKDLRMVGFFEGYSNLENEELSTILIKKAKADLAIYGPNEFYNIYNLKWNRDFFDMHVAKLDSTRVWWHDLERGIINGNNIYAKTIMEFESLSNGYLKVDSINESWINDNGPIEVSFIESDTLRTFYPKIQTDWYDIEFFNFLDSLMKKNGSNFNFYIEKNSGQDIFVLRATESEKDKIEKQMNWKFGNF